jgi:hypothetical protein
VGSSGHQGLKNLISLFSAKERTDFQQKLFDALLIYSRNNLAKEPSEKLIGFMAVEASAPESAAPVR